MFRDTVPVCNAENLNQIMPLKKIEEVARFFPGHNAYV
jgi:hypothetical protein